jgi:hypothetical protein
MIGYGAPRSIYGIHPRTLSSTEEFGPAPKKPRNASTAPGNPTGDKANARQKARLALHSTNLFSSAPAQPPPKASKNDANAAGTRRSTRITSSSTNKEKLQRVRARFL